MGTEKLEKEVTIEDETKELLCRHYIELNRRIRYERVTDLIGKSKCLDCRGISLECRDYEPS